MSCGVARCRALPCAEVLCRAVLCFFSSIPSTAVPGIHILYSSICFPFIWSLSVPMFPPPRKIAFFLPIERGTSNKHTAQHRAISSAQAARGINVNSLFAPNHAPHISAAFTCFSCILPCLSVAGGVNRRRSGALYNNKFVVEFVNRFSPTFLNRALRGSLATSD